MPVVGIPVSLLEARMGGDLPKNELIEELQRLGCDVEGFATLTRFKCLRCGNILEITETQDPPALCRRCGMDFTASPSLRLDLGPSEVIRMELLAVRPDMFDPGGLARTLRGYLGRQRGLASYPLGEVAARVTVDPALSTPACPRPAIACAVIRGIALSDDLIKVLMNLQENLHWALGRDRKHASIGVYDLGSLPAGDLRYRAVGLDEKRFVPLGFDPEDPAAALTPRQILELHPKGVEFARLLSGFEKAPLLEDGSGGVLSMPPIINSEHTRVKDGSTSLFIDVTGTNRRLVGRALNVLVTSLAELCPEISISPVTIAYPDGEVLTPDFTPQEVILGVEDTARLLGVDLDADSLRDLLVRMGHDVEQAAAGPGAGSLLVHVPAYRNDILHPRDLMEDAAIAYGYHRIHPVLVPTMTVGGERPVEGLARAVREAMCGLGFLEVMTLQLTSEEVAFDAMRLGREGEQVTVEHPISSEQTMLRESLAPGLLQTLAVNAHREYPQRIFEVGEVTRLAGTETGAAESRRVAAVITGARVGVTEARAAAEALLRELGWGIRTRNAELPSFLPGRSGELLATRGDEERVVGRLGELHPEVLLAFRLRHPASLFELDLTSLTGLA
ncbi:MAG: phenylalanine--tRNA ligase subunit beta [Polyangia bacterium]|jgi:phenylalanyl-tRNA synthetase beta chain|nr:phenylalanine--tRNA ligase subunit beta [Polyangia bacterium]